MRFFRQLLGVALCLAGIYAIGKDIMFTTYWSYYGWQRIPAAGSVLSILSGLWIVLNARSRDQIMGWGLIGFGMVLVFLSGGVILRPVTLWTFMIAFALLFSGYKLMTLRRF